MRDYFRNRQVLGSIRQLDVVVPSFFPKAGLVAYYKLDGNSNDSVGSNHGTVNGATYTASGKINGAYDFDGVNDYIDLNDTISKLFEGTKNYTFSCWAKFDNLSVNRTLLASKRGVSYGYLYRNCIISGGYNGSVFFGRTNTSGEDYCETPSSTITTNTWYHIVVTYDGSQMKIYVNNSLPTGVNNPKTSTRSASDGGYAAIGKLAENNSSYYHMDGIIDEVGIWSRVLTSDEITQLYNNGNGLTY
jgi:hypothetical protein